MEKAAATFDDLEHAYRVASWLGTLAVMEAVAPHPLPKAILKGTHEDNVLLSFCSRLHNGDDIKETINTLIAKRDENTNELILSVLQEVGILIGSHLESDFNDAYDIHTNDRWRNDMLKETELGRLMPLIEEVVAFYTPERVPEAFVDQLKMIRKNIEFYVGHYDPGF